jgi:hypothetical protein
VLGLLKVETLIATVGTVVSCHQLIATVIQTPMGVSVKEVLRKLIVIVPNSSIEVISRLTLSQMLTPERVYPLMPEWVYLLKELLIVSLG